MSTNTSIKFRKKSYNSSTDNTSGVVTFDTTTKKIFLAGDSYGGDALYVEKTYSQLAAMVTGGTLVKGQKYRITDYVTTTVQTDTTSANHAFDIVVTATDTNKLDCMAQAVLHSGDTYFSTAGADLEKWKVWYDINNDTTKYAWADSTNGKGVIYRMIDEWGNDCPYDFKNIQFKRKLTNGALDTANGTNTWVYTFNLYDQEDSTQYDASVSQFDFENDEGGYTHTYGNVIKRYGYGEDDGTSYGYPYQLNDIVFCNYHEDGDYFYGCYSNTFGDECYDNTFGDYCYENTFGDGCYSNTFGDECYGNTFGDGCYSNIFGDYCYHNTLGNYCEYNTFGDGCSSNTFGNYCSLNTFGNACYSNTLGNGCNHIIFGNSSNQGGSYCIYNIVENGNQYIRLYQTTGTAGINNQLQNVYIAQGVNNTNTYIDISTIARNLSYRTTVARLSDGTIRIYREDEDDMLPSLQGNENKVLTVNNSGTGIEWTEIETTQIDVTPITEIEYDYIFGKAGDMFLTVLYIDDFPPEIIPDLEYEYHRTFSEHIQAICNNVEYAMNCGTNFFTPTTETMTYEGDTYRIWMALTSTNGDGLTFGGVYGLMSDSITYTQLQSMSMESDINNRQSPFVAVFTDFDFVTTEPYTEDMGDSYTLIHVGGVYKETKPASSSHPSTFSKIYLEYYGTDGDYGFYENLYDSNAMTMSSFVDYVVNTEDAAQTFEYYDDLVYEGQTYQIWADEATNMFGGLISPNTTYQDIYPHTLEADTDNFYTPYCPFEYSWKDNDGDDVGGYDPVTDKWTTTIAIR